MSQPFDLILSHGVVATLMLDGTYLSRNFATLEPWISAAMCFLFLCLAAGIGFKVKANSFGKFRDPAWTVDQGMKREQTHRS